MKKLFKSLHKMEKVKEEDPKFSNVLFPLMRFLKRTYNLNTGEILTDFADTSTFSNFPPTAESAFNNSVGETSTLSKMGNNLSPVA